MTPEEYIKAVEQAEKLTDSEWKWKRIRAGLYQHTDGTYVYAHTVPGGGADWYLVLGDGSRLLPPFNTYRDAKNWYENRRGNALAEVLPVYRDVLRLDDGQ